MCTAIHLGNCFGRNLDLEYGYDQQVVILPRGKTLEFRHATALPCHYAMVGMAVVDNEYPLFFDAMNEMGLAMAGLDFPRNAYYLPVQEGTENIAPFELIPWILGQCASVAEAKALLGTFILADICYSATFPQAPLHWIIADALESIVVEPMKDGLRIYDNPVGVLTNNPPFPYHLDHLAGYQHLTPGSQECKFESIHFTPYGGGMGAMGLPGDFSSPSRFVKAAFVKLHAHTGTDETTEFFHLLDCVAMPRGAIRVGNGQDEITRYSCCCHLTEGVYYFTIYENRRIQAVQLHREDLSSHKIQCFPLDVRQDVANRN